MYFLLRIKCEFSRLYLLKCFYESVNLDYASQQRGALALGQLLQYRLIQWECDPPWVPHSEADMPRIKA